MSLSAGNALSADRALICTTSSFVICLFSQAEYGDEAVKQLRQREAEERRAARAAREQGDIDVNQIPLGEKVKMLVRTRFSPADI